MSQPHGGPPLAPQPARAVPLPFLALLTRIGDLPSRSAPLPRPFFGLGPIDLDLLSSWRPRNLTHVMGDVVCWIECKQVILQKSPLCRLILIASAWLELQVFTLALAGWVFKFPKWMQICMYIFGKLHTAKKLPQCKTKEPTHLKTSEKCFLMIFILSKWALKTTQINHSTPTYLPDFSHYTTHTSTKGGHLLRAQVMLALTNAVFIADDLVEMTPELDIQHPIWFH